MIPHFLAVDGDEAAKEKDHEKGKVRSHFLVCKILLAEEMHVSAQQDFADT